jgi:hypothetical protein
MSIDMQRLALFLLSKLGGELTISARERDEFDWHGKSITVVDDDLAGGAIQLRLTDAPTSPPLIGPITAHLVGGPKDGDCMLVAPLADGGPPVSVVFEEDVPIEATPAAEVEEFRAARRVGRYERTAHSRDLPLQVKYEWQGWS